VHVLRNVISNGLKFTEDGEVRLETVYDAERDRWRFVVTDTGIGIPPAEQGRVFEEFHQVPNHLQKHREGTGLGLPYARKLAELLGGTLTLTSTPGEGTEVVLDVPAVSMAPSEVETVLLVVDDDTLRTRMRHLTTPLARVVTEAADWELAQAASAERRPDVIVLGLSAPEADNRDCLEALRQDEDLADVPVMVLVAGDTDAADTWSDQKPVLLHRSRLSPDAVRDGLRQATHPIGRR
jgi:CheY-like chemotaxis protein